jgi:hypothetical protein
MFFTTAIAAFLVGSNEILVNSNPPENDQEQSESSERDKKLICRRINTEIGSRKTERVCLSREQWREYNRGN